jgi:hypothetical protein
MGDAFEINVGDLRQHASTVATISSEVNMACQLAQAALQGNAYGVIGQFLALALMQAGGDVRDVILKAVKSFTDVQSGLKAVADLYEQVDKAHADILRLTGEGTQK